MGNSAIASGLASLSQGAEHSQCGCGLEWMNLTGYHKLLLHNTVTSMVQVQLFKQFTRLQTSRTVAGHVLRLSHYITKATAQ